MKKLDDDTLVWVAQQIQEMIRHRVKHNRITHGFWPNKQTQEAPPQVLQEVDSRRDHVLEHLHLVAALLTSAAIDDETELANTVKCVMNDMRIDIKTAAHARLEQEGVPEEHRVHLLAAYTEDLQ